jgi:hypothetical protein
MKGDDDFCVDCEKDYLKSQLAEARDELESYKYDFETLVDIVSDCVHKMSGQEAFDVLKEVDEHYKKLKEKESELNPCLGGFVDEDCDIIGEGK